MWRRWGTVVCALAASACSQNSNTPDAGGDAAPPSDAAQDAGPSGDWSCLGHPAMVMPDASTATITFHNVDVAQQPQAGLTVHVCADLTDIACATPFDAGASTTDSSGNVTLVVPILPQGFGGYLETDVSGDIANLNVVTPPFTSNVTLYQRIRWNGAQVNVLFDTASGFHSDLTKYGLLGFEVHDCSGKPAGGVSAQLVTAASAAQLAYINVMSSKLDLTATQTDVSGQGGWTNIPPGTAMATWKVVATGQMITQMSVPVRVGAFTLLTPSPTL